MDPMNLGGLPPDLAAEQAGYARKMAIAQALMQQGMQGPQVYGGRMSPWAGLLSGLQQGLGAWALSKGAEEQAGLGQKVMQRTKDSLNTYLGTRDGQRGEVRMPEEPNPEAGWMEGQVTKPAMRADPRRAAVDAIGSGIPIVQQLGMRDLTEMGRNRFGPKEYVDLLKDHTPESVAKFAMSGGADVSALQRRPTFHAVGDTPGQYTGSAWEKLGPTLGEKWSEPYEVTGADGQKDIVQRSEKTGQIRKIDNAPRVTVNNDLGDRTRFEAGKASVKDLFDNPNFLAEEKGAIAAKNDMGVIQSAINEYNQGVRTGSLTDVRNFLSKLATTVGWQSTDPKVAPGDNMRIELAKRVLENINKLGAGTAISNADREFMEKIVAGRDLDAAGLEKFFDTAIRWNSVRLQDFDKRLDRLKKVPGTVPEAIDARKVTLDPFATTVSSPEADRAAGGAPVVNLSPWASIPGAAPMPSAQERQRMRQAKIAPGQPARQPSQQPAPSLDELLRKYDR